MTYKTENTSTIILRLEPALKKRFHLKCMDLEVSPANKLRHIICDWLGEPRTEEVRRGRKVKRSPEVKAWDDNSRGNSSDRESDRGTPLDIVNPDIEYLDSISTEIEPPVISSPTISYPANPYITIAEEVKPSEVVRDEDELPV